MAKLTAEECDDIAAKIDAEGFDYYFCDYGPDEKLEKILAGEILDYVTAKKDLMDALKKVGIDLDAS